MIGECQLYDAINLHSGVYLALWNNLSILEKNVAFSRESTVVGFTTTCFTEQFELRESFSISQDYPYRKRR